MALRVHSILPLMANQVTLRLSLTPDYIQGHDVPESIYRASPEWAASDLKYGITNGLEALYQRKFGKDNPPKTTTPAMKFGSMVHKFILEHSDFQ